MFMKSILVLLSTIFLTGCGGATKQDRTAPQQPNIIFIMADDLGYRHLGSYGQEKIETPHIDQLAAEGMSFTQSYAGATVCAPSRSVLMTGLHGGHTPVRGNTGGQPIADSDITVAEVLKKAGYATGGFGKWGLGDEGTTGHPLEQGFDEFVGYLHQVHAHFYYPYWLVDGHGKIMLPENEGRKQARYAHDVIVERAIEFIRKNKDRPFFCYLPVTIPHVELAVPESSLEQYKGRWPETPGAQEKRAGYIVSSTPKATYAAMVSHLDRDVGRIAALVKELGIDERTIIIFTSDNGGQGGADVQEEFFKANGELRGFKGSMYEGGLRVPMIVRWPERIRPGAVTEHITHFTDMMPTFAKFAGASVPSPTNGISFVPTLLGQGKQEQHDFLYWELVGNDGVIRRRGARMGEWKLAQQNISEPPELYNLESDLGETTDLATKHPEIVKKIEARIEAERTEATSYYPDKRVGIDDYVR